MEFALTTLRLTLRPFRADDAPALFAILQEPDIMQYFPTPTTPDMSRVELLPLCRQPSPVRFRRPADLMSCAPRTDAGYPVQ